MSADTRRILSFLALSVAAGLLFVADGTRYFERNVLDSSAFADNATHALEDESVRREMSREIVDRVQQQAPSVGADRARLEAAAQRMIGTRAFRRVFRAGALELHRFAFDDRRTALLFDLRNLDGPLRRAAERIEPGLGASIPAGFDARVGEISGEVDTTLADLQAFSQRAGGVADLTLLGGLILLALSVALAVSPSVALFRIGLTAIGIGVLYVIAYYVARGMLASELSDDIGKEAAKGAWDAVVGGLRDFNIGLAIAGLLLSAGVLFFGSRGDARAADGW